MIEIIIFIVASENPKNLNVISLQLVTVDCSSCFKSCSLSKAHHFLNYKLMTHQKNLVQYQNDKMKQLHQR